MAKRFGFGRKERLKSRKAIEALFTGGKSLSQFPIRAMYKMEESDQPIIQVGVTASKRHFKKAVDRNRIKRLLREAYRLQKHAVVEAAHNKGLHLHVFFMYMDKTLPDFVTIQETMSRCLAQLQKAVEGYERTA